jgi:very-short-patch-repair endonuclease
MSMVSDEIMRVAEQRNGLVTRDQLRSLGLSYQGIGRLTRSGLLHPVRDPVLTRVFQVEPGMLDFEQRALAVCLEDDGVTISHGTAAQLWNLRRAPRNQLEVVVGHRSKVSVPHLLVHRSNRLDERDVTHRVDGMRLTSPARVLFELAGVLDVSALRSAAEDALNRRLVSPESLHDVGERLLGRGRRGAKVFRELLELHPGDQPPVGSEDELAFEAALHRAGFYPVRQYPLALPGGQKVRLDFAFPEERVDVEIDHWQWHLDRAAQQRDKARDVAMSRLGWISLRFTDDDANRRTVACVAAVREVLATRRTQLGLGRCA